MTEEDAVEFIKSDKATAHYTSRSVAMEHILPSSELRASCLKYMNDPREYLERNTGIVYSGEHHEYSDVVMESLEHLRFRKPKVLSFCMSDTNEHIDNLGKCFSLPNMWAYYGEQHKGVCLIFNRDELVSLIDKSQLIFAEPIIYKQTIEGGHKVGSFGSLTIIDSDFGGDVDKFVEKHLTETAYPLLKIKDYNWSAEQEFRIVFKTEERDYSCLDFRKSLKVIVLGIDFPEVYLPSLLAQVPHDVNIFKSAWDDNLDTPCLQPVRRA